MHPADFCDEEKLMLLFFFVYLTAAVAEEGNMTCPSVCLYLCPQSASQNERAHLLSPSNSFFMIA